MNELHQVLRVLRRSPGYTALAVGTLALGLGANTAVFSAVNAVLLRPLPFQRPQELRILRPTLRNEQGVTATLDRWSYPLFEAFRDADPGLAELAAFTAEPSLYNLAGTEQPERVRVEIVSGNYFSLLGVSALTGQLFGPAEDQVPGHAPVAVLSDAIWRRLYGADQSIVGRTITLNTLPFTVVGVLPPGFSGLSGVADLWVPMMMAPALTFPGRLSGQLSFWHAVVGRVSPAAASELIAERLASAARTAESRIPLGLAFGRVALGFTAIPLQELRVSTSVRTSLAVLMGAAALVLLIVCVNVAKLVLTQTARRVRELTVCAALGATPVRLARRFVLETLVLASLGAGGGLLVAVWGLQVVKLLKPASFVGMADFSLATLDGPVAAFTFGVTLVTGAVLGVFPMAYVRHTDVSGVLKQSTPGVGGRVGPRGVLVVLEMALAITLLVGAGLLLRSLQHLRRTPLGFEPAGVLTASVDLPPQVYESDGAVRFLEEASARLRAHPGVRFAAVAGCLPLVGGCDQPVMEIEGRPHPEVAPDLSVWVNMVGEDYFRALGIPVLTGRTITAADRVGAPRVAVVSAAAAREYWPGQDPIGARIQLSVGWGPPGDWAVIVGVVGDVKGRTIEAPVTPIVYLSYRQFSYLSSYLVLKATTDEPLGLTDAMRGFVHDLDPTIPLWDVQTMEERAASAVSRTRFSAVLLSMAAALAAVLAALGVFG
ncbi:MAG: ABC transporter permease, partial [Gemmatimonadetes bacterium]|nr:ABC transporter permease [Gemmatimonadota bacterium]